MFEVNNHLKNANLPRTIRFTEEIFDQLNHLAAQNKISFNLLVLQCCQYALDNTYTCREKLTSGSFFK